MDRQKELTVALKIGIFFFEELTASPCYKATNSLLASTKKGTCLASLTSQSIIFDYCFWNITQSERQNKGKVKKKTALIVEEIPFRHHNKKWVENSEWNMHAYVRG